MHRQQVRITTIALLSQAGALQQCRLVVLSIFFSVHPLADIGRTVLKLHAFRPATFRNLTASRSASLTSPKSRMMFRYSRSKSSFSSGICAASIPPFRVNTVNLSRVDLSILKVICCRRDALHCHHPGPVTPGFCSSKHFGRKQVGNATERRPFPALGCGGNRDQL